MARILIVDDDTTFCIMLKNWLEKRKFQVDAAFSHAGAMESINNNNYDIILTDLRLPDKDGIDLLRRVKERAIAARVILMTGYADIPTAVTAMKLGAFDYVTKPVIPDEILKLLRDALETAVKTPRGNVAPSSFALSYLKGVSEGATRLHDHLGLVAPTMMTVLISGESGTGKEYIARRVHENSTRAAGPFVAVDCGAIPRELAGSEFFGHVKGSFTGAVSDKEGYFTIASGGTLFLDEIGNLSHDVQVQLLRVLEERRVRPVGGERDMAVDVRVISATNDNLKEAVDRGRFREDLYHRLNEFSLVALPLRERQEDIPLFANHFLDRSTAELGKSVTGFSPAVMEIFQHYRWPGNLREMRNVIKRATLLCNGKFISREHLPAELWQAAREPARQSGSRRDMERELIIEVMTRCDNNKTEAARVLQIDRKTLYNKLKVYGIDPEATAGN
ncbi:MAG: sigma-54 dependent transcriptional regulator [Odoribacteraceae bacterium]|jgi:two-component system response regulator HydG|nr:sigma-54 dependent transcriptional regulator [Odoribacteraceae bacterium]